jgi:hypothetical protein
VGGGGSRPTPTLPRAEGSTADPVPPLSCLPKGSRRMITAPADQQSGSPGLPARYTPNPKPQTPNPKLPNPKPQTPNPRTPNPKFHTPNPEPQTPNRTPQLARVLSRGRVAAAAVCGARVAAAAVCGARGFAAESVRGARGLFTPAERREASGRALAIGARAAPAAAAGADTGHVSGEHLTLAACCRAERIDQLQPRPRIWRGMVRIGLRVEAASGDTTPSKVTQGAGADASHVSGEHLSGKYGKYKTVTARFWPWLSGETFLVFPSRSSGAVGGFASSRNSGGSPKGGRSPFPPPTPVPSLATDPVILGIQPCVG